MLPEALEEGAEKREYARVLEEDIANKTGVKCAQGSYFMFGDIHYQVYSLL